MKILSHASKNPERQAELVAGIERLSAGTATIQFASDDDDALVAANDAEIILAHRVTPELFSAGKHVKWIHITGAGVERSLFPAIAESDVVMTNSRGLHAQPIAEWTLGALLYWAQRFDEAEAWRRDREWKQHKKLMTEERKLLKGKRALIVGMGEVGRGIADLLHTIGMHVEGIATTARNTSPPVYANEELDQRLGEADVVIIALPLTKNTRGLFNRRLFVLMKEQSVLMNVGRGAIVDEEDLIAALDRGKPGFALLDVFREEPLPPDSPLFTHPNIFMTPHVSGNFSEYTREVNAIFLENFERYVNGEPLRFVVDKKRGY
ncbi:D-2-hydroxyacid dehydrogenase [bacterium]|nr:D-2-hydroxyacid dehydrogenase [bacterium]